MTPERLWRRHESTLVPSHGSTFVYMITRREFTQVVVLGRELHSGTKSRNGIM